MTKLVKINNISGTRQVVPGHGSAGPGFYLHVPANVAAQLCAGDSPAWDLDKPKQAVKPALKATKPKEVSDVAD